MTLTLAQNLARGTTRSSGLAQVKQMSDSEFTHALKSRRGTRSVERQAQQRSDVEARARAAAERLRNLR